VGLFTLRTLGVDAVRSHNAALAAYGQRVVADALGAGDLPPPAPGLAMRLVPLPAGLVPDKTAATALRNRISDEIGVEVNIDSRHGEGMLRLCAQVYNRADEYDRLADRLPAVLKRR
jgi:isopenicillin-N epimerase